MVCRILLKKSRYEGEFTPPMLDRPTVYTPGFGGGAEWGGVSVDVDRGIMIVNWNRYTAYGEHALCGASGSDLPVAAPDPVYCTTVGTHLGD
jgi:glucose dehydrogenase